MGEFLSCPVYLSGLCFFGGLGFSVCLRGKYPSQGTCERNLADFLGFMRAPSNPCLREADPRDQEALLRAMVKRSRVMGPPRLPVLARLLRLAYVASTTGSPETTDKLGGAAVTGTRSFQATPARRPHPPPAAALPHYGEIHSPLGHLGPPGLPGEFVLCLCCAYALCVLYCACVLCVLCELFVLCVC